MNRSMVQTVALVFGIVYTAVGVVGFLPFIGGSYTLTDNNLLGIFSINIVHNIVHLVIGIAALAAAGSLASSKVYCQVFGVVLLAVGVVGFLVPGGNLLGILPLGGLDIGLHLVTGAILAYFGFVAATSPRRAVA